MEGAHNNLSGAPELPRERWAEELAELIERCAKCDFVDKPFIRYRVYERWLPERVDVLVVVESPPPGEKEDFFYNLSKSDRLRRNLKLLLGLEITDEDLLAWLKERGVFITDAIKCRPVKRALRDVRLRVRMCLSCLYILEREVELLRPRRVIVMGETAQLASA